MTRCGPSVGAVVSSDRPDAGDATNTMARYGQSELLAEHEPPVSAAITGDRHVKTANVRRQVRNDMSSSE